MSESLPSVPPICDYEGSDYQTRFWQNQGREYEDLVERIAIRHLLPRQGRRLLEIGAGFGRLADMYSGYERVVLLDYSKSLLRQAQARLGRNERYCYVAANVYQLPLQAGQFDAVSMVRVIHHLADVPRALAQIWHVLVPGGTFLLEFASKFHLKSILRYALRRQTWSPFDLPPIEFVPLNFDFHPRWMRQQLMTQGFTIQRVRALSHLRVAWLKRVIPARLLAWIDGLLQPAGMWWPCAPSLMLRAVRPVGGQSMQAVPDHLEFACPICHSHLTQQNGIEMHCATCQRAWPIDNGIYDFKT